jgi:hypothetical protein
MSNFIELNDLPVYDDLLKELTNIVDLDRDQYCINAPKGHEDDDSYGLGSNTYNWSNKTIDQNGNEHIPLRDTPLLEEQFTELCTKYKNTKFEIIYNELSKKYILGRVRIMQTRPGSCWIWHRDQQERVHYPIKTQEGCFMIIENEIKHLEQNKWYYTKTLKPHTAFNGSKEKRIHLIANILGLR